MLYIYIWYFSTYFWIWINYISIIFWSINGSKISPPGWCFECSIPHLPDGKDRRHLSALDIPPISRVAGKLHSLKLTANAHENRPFAKRKYHLPTIGIFRGELATVGFREDNILNRTNHLIEKENPSEPNLHSFFGSKLWIFQGGSNGKGWHSARFFILWFCLPWSVWWWNMMKQD